MSGTRVTRTRPSFASVTNLVARNLGLSTTALLLAFRPAEVRDLPALLALRREVLGQHPGWDDTAYMHWRYGLSDPPHVTPARIFVLAPDGVVIACVGVEEFDLAWRGTRHASGCPMDLVVTASCHDVGLGVWMNLALFERYPTLIAMGANENSAGLIKGLFSPLAGRNLYQYPIDVRGYLVRRLGVLGRVFGAPLAALVNAGLHLAQFPLLARQVDRRDLRAVEITAFDASMDALLRAETEVAPEKPGDPTPIALVRDTVHLNWRYCADPRQNYHVFAARHAERCVGYLVYRRRLDASGAGCIHIADWVVQRADSATILRLLLAVTIRRARNERVAYLSVSVKDREAEAALRAHGFWRRAVSGSVTAVHARDPVLEHALSEAEGWRFTDFGDDGDGF